MFNKHPRAIILTTEKDAVRLRRARMPERMMRAMYYQPIAMRLIDGPDRDDFVESLVANIKFKERGAESKDSKKSNVVDDFD